MKKPTRTPKPYPSDVSDEEWSYVAPYLTLNRVDGENRKHDLRAVFNALRWLVRSGASWRMMPHEFPPWPAVYQQMRRWLDAGCFEAMVHDLRVLLREYAGRQGQPSAMILDSRTIQSTPESGARAGYDGAKRRKGAKVHAAVDTFCVRGVTSPLLANCYLHLLDRIWQRHHLKRKLQAHLVRYADDFVVLCKRDVQAPLAVIRQVLDRLGLTLNEAKTQVVDAREASFNFLGFAIRISRGLRTGKPYPHVCPSAKALARIKARVTQLTGRERTLLPLETLVGQVNFTLRGWANYFHHGNSSQALEKLKIHAEECLRQHLMKRHKVKDRRIGAGRYPSRDLYARYGLYKVPTIAGWRSAHALT